MPPDSPVVLSVGELNGNKNVETLVRAVSVMKHRDAVVYICGEGKRRKKIMRLIRRHKLESRVYMLGYRTDVPALMKMADDFEINGAGKIDEF